MSTDTRCEVAVIGTGIAGVATAYYLCAEHHVSSVLLIDPRQPMSFTSAQSGDNYRNWWPHPVMTAFISDSLDELDRLARDTDDVFNMTRGGYVLATRDKGASDLAGSLEDGIDVDLHEGSAVHKRYPYLADGIRRVVHIRRGGDISGQQLGAFMLGVIRDRGGRQLRDEVMGIDDGFVLTLESGRRVRAERIVNAAGPFAGQVAAMLGEELPVTNVFQQKVAFEDRLGVVSRDMPFSIDLDPKTLEWTDEERAMLCEDADLEWLAGELPGGTHCRPEGGANGNWVKLGWAYNRMPSEPQRDLANEPRSDPQFPEIVMRGAAALVPALRQYVDNPPARYSHYGGYYTMTDENWPLIGPMGPEGAFMVAALSGFGCMAACAAGRLCAAWLCGSERPDYAPLLSRERYANGELMRALRSAQSKGLL